MRATEIIRGVLDLIDQIDCAEPTAVEPAQDPITQSFKDIFAQLTGEPKPVVYDNSPDVHIQGVNAVTTDAGLGGWMGAKNPADLKSNSISLYPGYQAEKK